MSLGFTILGEIFMYVPVVTFCLRVQKKWYTILENDPNACVIYLFIYTHMHFWKCEYGYVCLYIYEYAQVCIGVDFYVCMNMNVHLCKCIYLHTYLYVL